MLTRRKSLQIGGLGLAGLWSAYRLGNAWGVEGKPGLPPKAKSVIFLHQYGGPSHIDTFDMKPQAPDGIRGEFKAVSSSIAGVPVCEHLPRWGAQLHQWAQVRSVHHDMKNHNPACYYSLTGKRPPTDDIRLRDTLELYPAYGSTVAKFSKPVPGVPTFVAYPHVLRDGAISPGQHASFLGKQCDPYFFQADPNAPDFSLPELQLPADIDLNRLERRRELVKLIDEDRRLIERSAEARGLDTLQEQALQILSSTGLRDALDLGREDTTVRDAYGRTTYGQSCLLARRLVESGVRFVTVYFSQGIGGNGSEGWDTHQENFKDLRERLLPATDRTVPTLIDDLESRGLLEDTLVLWMGEFGRGPQIGDRDGKGRGHWPDCYTVMMAGGGIQGGTIFGQSDAKGAYPASDPVGPEDIAATIYWALGIDPAAEVIDTQGRPLPISTGAPIQKLFR
ncbi:MAG: DUF1501 domain-containing protein [Pirellula sp.]|nr:DUF1501 domain-containing protein [Pirellula sp.]